jgi:hypothetical protein
MTNEEADRAGNRLLYLLSQHPSYGLTAHAGNERYRRRPCSEKADAFSAAYHVQ